MMMMMMTTMTTVINETKKMNDRKSGQLSMLLRGFTALMMLSAFSFTIVDAYLMPTIPTKTTTRSYQAKSKAYYVNYLDHGSPFLPSGRICNKKKVFSSSSSSSSVSASSLSSSSTEDHTNMANISSSSSSSSLLSIPSEQSSSKKSLASSAKAILNRLDSDQKSILSATLLIALDIAFRRVFQALDLKFPSSLGGCCMLLITMLTTKRFGQRLYEIFNPGAQLLAKWLPVFFVPSLITLPLVGNVFGNATEILKVLGVIVGGFYFTLLTTAGTVVSVGRLSKKGKINGSGNNGVETTTSSTTKEPQTIDTPQLQPTAPTPSKPFSDILMKQLRIVSIFTGIAALEGFEPAFTSMGAKLLVKYKLPIYTTWSLSTTLATFCYGARLSKSFTKIVHPLVTCTTLMWALMKLFSKCVSDVTFTNTLQMYKMGSGFNGIFGTGAGDILLFMLGPAVLSLAVSMYEKRQLIQDNFKQIGAGVAVSSIGGLFGTAFMVRLAQIVQPSLRVALLSRNITSPLAMAIASILGASGATISIAVSLVVVTGLVGANFGASILNAVGIKNPVARGMGIGAAAHGLGTAAFVNEKDAFPFAAISMALTATACTVLVSVPFIKKLVLQIALGGGI